MFPRLIDSATTTPSPPASRDIRHGVWWPRLLTLALIAPLCAWAAGPEGDASPFTLPPLPASAEPLSTQPETVRLERMLFVGNTVVSTATLDALAAPYLHRELNESDLESLRLAVTQHYVRQGYVNSGAVWANPMSSGSVLTLRLIEGHLSEIRLQGLDRLRPQYLRQRLAPEPDAVLQLALLRARFQQLLEDPLIERLQAQLRPGQAPGQAILEVEVLRARPYQLTLATHNYRPSSIGAQAVELSGWVRNLSGWGDVLEGSLQRATASASGLRSQWHWTMPLADAKTAIHYQGSHGQSSLVEEPMRALDFQSTLSQHELGLQRVWYEDLQQRFSTGAHYGWRTQRSWLAGSPFSLVPGEPDGKTHIRGWRLWQEYSYRTERHALALRATWQQQHNNLQPGAMAPFAGTPTTADSHARIWLLQGHYARQVLDNGAQWLVRATAQYARQRLLALDRLALGGATTVRGFPENQWVRDQGQIINLEFDYPLVRGTGAQLQWSLIPFYDFGRGQNQGESASRIASAGLATRLRWQGWHLDLAVGHPLQGQRSAGSGWQHQGLHLHAGYDFF